jgi:tripartite-type tricarboxylate transporter receptor subunit TctC
MTALLGGHAFVAALSTGAVSPQAAAGKLRVLASSGAKRPAAFPDTPTLKELGYDIEYYLWTGIFVRKEVPPDVLNTIRAAVRQAVQDPEFVKASQKMQMLPDYLDAPEFKPWWDKDSEMLARAIRRIPPPDAK